MWLTRQQGHKCHVFVGNSPDLLEKMREAVAADKAATLVFVGKREELLRCGAEEEELDRLGCACLEGNVEKVDAQTCVLMTRYPSFGLVLCYVCHIMAGAGYHSRPGVGLEGRPS